MTRFTPVFLVLLRLAIGWHFFFEGLEKLNKENWTSAGYLREAVGPLAPQFRNLAGEPLIERLTPLQLPHGTDLSQIPLNQRMPGAQVVEWDAYLQRFTDHYGLDATQRTLAETKLQQQKDQYVRWLLGTDGGKKVKREGYGVTFEQDMTLPQRVDEYRTKIAKVHELQDVWVPLFTPGDNAKVASRKKARELQDEELATFSPDLSAKLSTAKGDANRVLVDLRKDMDSRTKDMQKELQSVLTAEQKERAGPLAPSAPLHWRQWTEREWADAIVRYGLTAVGLCLLLGLFTRLACVGGAVFLLMFTLALPALPGLPANPRAEGTYLFINKNIIEMLALLALATTYSGCWVGLDGLVQFLNPFRWRKSPSRPAVIRDAGRLTPRPDLAPENGAAPLPVGAEPAAITPHSPTPRESTNGD
ncbi:MAG: DoxX family protein [Gemmataceae bacterium]|nr:DoxX family protein [Gemmataceae bacterium]